MAKWSGRILTFVLFLIISDSASAQRLETGFFAGYSNYQGDLTPDFNWTEWHGSGGAFIKINTSPYTSWTFGVYEGFISGNDQNYRPLVTRNLSFQTKIVEFSTLYEFNFRSITAGFNSNPNTPYLFTGLALFTFDPKANYEGTIVKLNPMDTEGKRIINKSKNSYSLYNFSIPLGGGIKYRLTNRFNLAIFLGYRLCFTDYLDDVSTSYYDKDQLENRYGEISAALSDRSYNSYGYLGKQRGRSDLKDWYIFSGISLSYKIKNASCPFN